MTILNRLANAVHSTVKIKPLLSRPPLLPSSHSSSTSSCLNRDKLAAVSSGLSYILDSHDISVAESVRRHHGHDESWHRGNKNGIEAYVGLCVRVYFGCLVLAYEKL